MGSTLFLVVPCYNEEEVLNTTAMKLEEKMKALIGAGNISDSGKVVFVDDGSRDGTWAAIEKLCARDKLFAGVKLSRNSGHQSALLAGLMAVKDEADMVISIDADLQDDINAIDKMVEEYNKGCDVVYGVRDSRKNDGFFKRSSAQGYYKLLRSLGCDIVFNHADYRLMSARAIETLSGYNEQRPFLRGLVPLLGYKASVVEYERGVREAGNSKYPLKRMLTLAMDGLMSLSMRPLRIITVVGSLMLIAAAAMLVYRIVLLCMGQAVLDWEIVTFSIWAVGGIITLSLGIVGEYVGRVYFETKRRPRYNIDKTTGLLNMGVNND